MRVQREPRADELDLRQEWVELAPFELRRLCADCREKKLEDSRGFLLRLACSRALFKAAATALA